MRSADMSEKEYKDKQRQFKSELKDKLGDITNKTRRSRVQMLQIAKNILNNRNKV